MLKFIKKQSVSSFLTFGALILTIISFIIYGANVGGAGYFHGSAVTSLVVFSILEILLLSTILVLSQFEFKGIIGKSVKIFLDVLKMLAAVLLALSLMAFISSRVEGLAYIFFSNPDIIATIQTAENLSSARSAIVGFVFYGITILMVVVCAFFSANKSQTKIA